MKIAHIINVTEINNSQKTRYLHIAQPLTMRSMVVARETAKHVADIELIAVKHKNETVRIPSEFRWAADLDRYAWEYIKALRKVIPHKPLPRIVDIISSLYTLSDAEYFIYTNLDIGLSPHFYLKVRDMVAKGYDAFCINRRDLPKEYEGVMLDESKIELINTIEGITHPGIDCFVFKREIVPSLNLGNVYIGYPPVGHVLKTQIESNSKNSTWIKDGRLTFHIGSDQAWQNIVDPYFKENKKQSITLSVKLFKRILYQILRDKLKSFIYQS